MWEMLYEASKAINKSNDFSYFFSVEGYNSLHPNILMLIPILKRNETEHLFW
jgi:hypothetical protein